MSAIRGALGAMCCLGLSGCILTSGIPDWEVSEEVSATGEAPEKVAIDVANDELVDATVNGHAVRLRVEIGHTGLVLNPDTAARLGLLSTVSGKAMVGPVEVKAYSAVADVTSGPGTSRQRIYWYERSITDGADGIITLADLPYRNVTLRLSPPRAGEVETVLQTMVNHDSIVYRLPVAGSTIDVRFYLDRDRTTATSAAAAILGESHGGKWSGEERQYPITLGIERAVRPMTLAKPVNIGDAGSLDVSQFLARMRDWKGKTELPVDPAQEGQPIVVEGNRGSRSEYFLTLGRDVLDRCSSVTYERETQILRLRCGGG